MNSVMLKAVTEQPEPACGYLAAEPSDARPEPPSGADVVADLRLLRERGLVRIRHNELAALRRAVSLSPAVPAEGAEGWGAGSRGDPGAVPADRAPRARRCRAAGAGKRDPDGRQLRDRQVSGDSTHPAGRAAARRRCGRRADECLPGDAPALQGVCLRCAAPRRGTSGTGRRHRRGRAGRRASVVGQPTRATRHAGRRRVGSGHLGGRAERAGHPADLPAAVATPRPGTNDYDVIPTAITQAVYAAFAMARNERPRFTPPLNSLGFPLLGAGRGGLDPASSFAWIWAALEREIPRDNTWAIHFITHQRATAEVIVAGISRSGGTAVPGHDGHEHR